MLVYAQDMSSRLYVQNKTLNFLGELTDGRTNGRTNEQEENNIPHNFVARG